jgi:hydroxymethylglutaryl-CoA lyase
VASTPVSIREVGPRDGFQNEPEIIPTDDKVRLVEMLARTGLRRLEVTSFVRADVIPQLADGAEVLRRADVPDDVSVTVLIPNERGLDNAFELREHFQEVNLFLSASETHNRKNVNRSIEESLSGLERVVARTRADGLRCEGVISVAFGCPYEGDVPPERVFAIARRLVEAGCEEIAFGDTTGMANPRQVKEFFSQADLGVELTAHFHNTRGQGSRTWWRRSTPASALSRARSASSAVAPSRRAQRGTSRARTSSRCCTRWATRPASTSNG